MKNSFQSVKKYEFYIFILLLELLASFYGIGLYWLGRLAVYLREYWLSFDTMELVRREQYYMGRGVLTDILTPNGTEIFVTNLCSFTKVKKNVYIDLFTSGKTLHNNTC
jgi:hypothetical protein